MIRDDPMWLVYEDSEGGYHYQPWQDVVGSGTLVDPKTYLDMEIIGWTDSV